MTTTNEPASCILCTKYQYAKSIAAFDVPHSLCIPLGEKPISIGNIKPSAGIDSFHIDVTIASMGTIIGRIENGVLSTNAGVFVILRSAEKITNMAQMIEPTKATYPHILIPVINSRTPLLLGDVMLLIKSPWDLSAREPFQNSIEWYSFCFPSLGKERAFLMALKYMQRAAANWNAYLKCFAFPMRAGAQLLEDVYTRYVAAIIAITPEMRSLLAICAPGDKPTDDDRKPPAAKKARTD